MIKKSNKIEVLKKAAEGKLIKAPRPKTKTAKQPHSIYQGDYVIDIYGDISRVTETTNSGFVILTDIGSDDHCVLTTEAFLNQTVAVLVSAELVQSTKYRFSVAGPRV